MIENVKINYSENRNKEIIIDKEVIEYKNKSISKIVVGDIDSYDKFLEKFKIDKNDFYQFGLNEIIYPNIEDIDDVWEELKSRLCNNKEVYIRGYGRDAHGTILYKKFHEKVFGNTNIKKDSTNNSRPQKIITDLTKYKRNKNLFNYQVSHIFGMTRNALMFEAPWNIAFIPKIIDPLTGHEAKGEHPKVFQQLFLETVYEKYKKYIDDYNSFIGDYHIEEEIKTFVEKDAGSIIKKYSEPRMQKLLFKNLSDDFKILKIKA